METRQFVILASNKAKVEDRIKKLNKRAVKLGVEQIVLSFGKAYTETRTVEEDSYSFGKKTVQKEFLVIPVDVTGPFEVKYDGWEFAATLQHLPTGENIIRSIIEVPSKYRNVNSNCEHCNTYRKRNDTYVLHKGGTFTQVGSSCMKDFLGGNSPDNILSLANFASDIITCFEGESEMEGSEGSSYVQLEEFIAHTAVVIEKYGWVSKKEASDRQKKSTSTLVDYNIFGGPKDYEKLPITEEHRNYAAKAIEWAENLSDEDCVSDYLYNLRAIARAGYVEVRTYGFAASLVAAYKRNLGEQEERAKRVESKHVGKVKDRRVFELTLIRVFSYSSMYGVSNKLLFKDKEGNYFLWSTGEQQVEEGKEYKVKGTIKEHSFYKEMAQTVLTRCQFIEG